MKQHFKTQIEAGNNKLVYIVMDDLSNELCNLSMYHTNLNDLETLSEKYDYQKHRGNIPVFSKKELKND